MRFGMPWWVGHGDPLAGIETAAKLGFDLLELSLEAPWPSGLDADGIREALGETGLELGVHGPWRAQTLGHPRSALAGAALEVALDALGFAEDAGAAYLVLHVDPRDYGRYPREDVLDQARRHAVQGLSTLADRARDVEVVVENTFPPLGTPAAMEAVLDDVPGLGFCFDPGHALITQHADGEGATGEPGVWYERLGDRLTLLHAMDVAVTGDGVVDHLVPGAGELDVGLLVEGAKRAGCDRCVLECFHRDLEASPADHEDLARAREDLRLA